MAEGGVSEEGLEETSRETQECSICFSEFKEPRLLECSHRFCLKCLQELKQAAQNEDDKKIVCPLCRKETILPEGGVDKLPCSQEGANKEEHPDGGQVPMVICQACDEENEAIYRCMDCEHYLCKECKRAHQRWAALRSHKIATLEELGPDGKLKDYVPKCKEHPDQEVCLYCNSCDVLICNKCTASCHQAPGHFYISIDEAFNRCKKEINEAISQTNACLKNFTRARPLSTSRSRDRLAMMLRRTKIRISLKADEEVSKIREKEQKLKHEAEEIFYERDKEFASPITAEKAVSKVSNVMSTASCYEVIESTSELLQDLREQVKIHKSINTFINHAESFLGFKESHDAGELGSLVLNDEWKMVKTNDGNCSCFEAFSKERVVLAGYRKLICDGTEFSETGSRLQVKNPTKLTPIIDILDEPYLFVLDSPQVNILYSGSTSTFIPGKYAGIGGTPTCLAVNTYNCQIAVGYEYRKQISLHTRDGSHIRNLPAPGIGHHLTISDQKLIYTYSQKYKNEVEVRCIDYEGKEIFQNVKCKGHHPGLVCSGGGSIFVAVSDVIWQFSGDGAYINTLSCEAVKNPTDMKFSPQGSLLMLNKEGLWEYQTFSLKRESVLNWPVLG